MRPHCPSQAESPLVSLKVARVVHLVTSSPPDRPNSHFRTYAYTRQLRSLASTPQRRSNSPRLRALRPHSDACPSSISVTGQLIGPRQVQPLPPPPASKPSLGRLSPVRLRLMPAKEEVRVDAIKYVNRALYRVHFGLTCRGRSCSKG